MAERKNRWSARPAPELTHYSEEDEDYYLGTLEQLVAATGLPAAMFPGQPGQNKSQVTVRSPRRIEIMRTSGEFTTPRTYRVSIQVIDRIEVKRKSSLQLEREAARAALYKLIDSGEDVGVIRREEPCFTEWVGTKSALIAAGVCTEQQFPIGRKRLAWNSDRGHEVPRWTTRALRAGYFTHTVDQDREHRQAQDRRELPPLYADRDQFADACESSFMAFRHVIHLEMTGELETRSRGVCSFRYDAATVEKIVDALDHVQQLLQAAVPVTVQAPRKSDAHDHARATNDPQFRDFMRTALSEPKAPVARRKRNTDRGNDAQSGDA